MNYFEWIKALSDIYLEDSYVLEIRERAKDYCNIDAFYRDGNKIFIEGDWGELSLVADEVMVFIAL